MHNNSKNILFVYLILAISVFFTACNKQNDVDSNKNQKNIQKKDYSKILTDVKDQVFATLEYSVGVDSVNFAIIIHNNSKHTVFYPSCHFVINDMFPLYEWIPRFLNNGNLITIHRCDKDAGAMSDPTIDDKRISPYYHSILGKDSLIIKFAMPIANYFNRHYEMLLSYPDYNCLDININMFIVINEELASKYSAPSESRIVEYSSFIEYKKYQSEYLLFDYSGMKYNKSDAEDFYDSFFVVECDTILDIEAIYNVRTNANSNE